MHLIYIVRYIIKYMKTILTLPLDAYGVIMQNPGRKMNAAQNELTVVYCLR